MQCISFENQEKKIIAQIILKEIDHINIPADSSTKEW